MEENQTENQNQKLMYQTYLSNLSMAYALQEFYWERIIFDRQRNHRGEQLPPLSWRKFCYWTDELTKLLEARCDTKANKSDTN